MNTSFHFCEINSEKGRFAKLARDYGPCPTFAATVTNPTIILPSCSFSDYPVISQILVENWASLSKERTRNSGVQK